MSHYARATRTLFPDDDDAEIDAQLAIEDEISRESIPSPMKSTSTSTSTTSSSSSTTSKSTTLSDDSLDEALLAYDPTTSTSTSKSTSTSTSTLTDDQLVAALLAHDTSQHHPTLKDTLQIYECESCHSERYNRAYWEAFHVAGEEDDVDVDGGC